MMVNNFVPLQEIFNNLSVNNGNIKSVENESIENNFQSVLEDSLNKLNDQQISADKITSEFIAGEDIEVHEMMLNMEEANMSLQLAIQVRNKVVEAVQELSRMQL